MHVQFALYVLSCIGLYALQFAHVSLVLSSFAHSLILSRSFAHIFAADLYSLAVSMQKMHV